MPDRSKMFADIDRKDADAWAAYLAEDVTFRFGNPEPTIGRKASRDGLAAFYGMIDGVSHNIRRQWQQGNTTIVDSEVTYTRKDGRTVTLPIVTIYHVNGDDLIDDYRVYADTAPIFA